jgi:hypothetical protein
MSNWVVAIPSYKRPIAIREKTLKMLKSYNIPLEQIYIFVATAEEAVIYAKENPDYRIVIGVLGLPQQRNFIIDYFEMGQNINALDDDIEGIYQLISKKEQTMKRLPNFVEFIDQVFSQLREKGLQLCGIYPCRNAFFMYDKISTDLRFCIGCMCLFINDKLFLSEKVIQKDDYERTLISYNKYSGVLRYNNICVKTKFYSTGGAGNGLERNMTNENDTTMLYSMYQTQLKMWRRKNGTAEVKFVKRIQK